MINGNTIGIKDSALAELEALYEEKIPADEFAGQHILEVIARISGEYNREISVFLSRNGRVLDLSVGKSDQVTMPHMRTRRGSLGLSGVRCIHTHPSGSPMVSAVDIGTLLSSRMDAMAAVSVADGKPRAMTVAMIGETLAHYTVYGPFAVGRIPGRALMAEIERATFRVNEMIRLADTGEQKEKAMLIGLNATEQSMEELRRLADTAGAEVVYAETQNRERDRATCIGKGKARELSLKASALDADMAIFDDELTPTEAKNLEDILGIKVIDRTALILDIFAAHAKTREGRLQVELAQLKYNLPRLSGEGTMLSRLGGGIGTRGPGEKKIEVDRRRIRRRIFELEEEIRDLERQRSRRREQRKKNRVLSVALVGYTNAGKSSLLNALTQAGVLAQDKLFVTLDPVTRKVVFPSGKEAVFTDTVGFIEKLPHDLISAFRSTLEEAVSADILLHVIDASNPAREQQKKVVYQVLKDLGALGKPILEVYNKADLAKVPAAPGERPAVWVSAKTGQGLSELLTLTEEAARPKLTELTLKLAYHKGEVLSMVHRCAEEVETEYYPEYMEIRAKVPADAVGELLKAAQQQKSERRS